MPHADTTLLIVDDVVENITVLGEALSGLGEIQFATSGPEGLAMARRDPPTLILLDIMMPEVDGFEVCQALKADPATRDIPVLFVTAKSDSETEARALGVGGIDFLEKPIHADVVRQRVALHLLLRRREEQLRHLNESLEATVARRTLELERKTDELEATLKELSTKTAVLDKAPFGVLVLDPFQQDPVLEYVNEAFCRMSEYAVEDILGRRPSFLFGEQTSADGLRDIGSAIREKRAAEGELVFYTRSGRPRLGRWLVFPSYGVHSELLKVIVGVTDITEFREAQQARKRLEAELQESSRLEFLGLTIAGIAHDLNTPIGVAVTAATHAAQTTQRLVEALAPGHEDHDKARRLGQTLLRSSDLVSRNLSKAAQLVSGFKKTTADVTRHEWRSIKLLELLESLAMTLSPVMRRAHCEVVLNCPAALSMYTEPSAIAQAVTNLMVNATLHAFEGREDRQLRIDVEDAPEHVTIVVADNGNGMSEEAALKAFTPFFTTRRGSGGSGLGLFSSRRAIEQVLGGQVTLETRPGVGTSFRIELPKQAAPRRTPSTPPTSSAADAPAASGPAAAGG